MLSEFPASSEISRIGQIFRLYKGNPFAYLSREYRKAKRSLLRIIRKRSMARPKKALDKLEKLEILCREKERFEKEESYSLVFGVWYKGLETDIEQLEKIVSWIDKLITASGSVGLASNIVRIHAKLRKMYFSIDDIKKHWEKANRLIYLFQDILDSERTPLLGEDILNIPLEKLIDNSDKLKTLLGSVDELVRPIISSDESRLEDIIVAAYNHKRAREIVIEFEQDKYYESIFEYSFNEIRSNFKYVSQTINWVGEIKSLGLPRVLLNLFNTVNCKELLLDIQARINNWEDHFNNIRSGVNLPSDFDESNSDYFCYSIWREYDLSSFMSRIGKIVGDIGSLPDWAEYCRIEKRGRDKGLSTIIDILVKGELEPEKAESTFLYTVYNVLTKMILTEYPELSTFKWTLHEEKRKRYVELDKNILKHSVKLIASRASQHNVPWGISRGPVRDWTEKALLQREISKRRRHIPIRRLLERAGRAIKALKPVFMMSPMSVAQFLEPGKHEFDVIIMDEASQIEPHDALGAIARGKQIIIVGDPKQLPPTNFFKKELEGDDLDESETAVDDIDSILEVCLASGFPKSRLKWHYRSEHESLIAFSNSLWYDNELIIFPSPSDSQKQLGVQFHYIVKAKYSNGKNEREAEIVAEAILKHANKSPHLSLGIGTFNIKQKYLIEDRLERLRKSDPANDRVLENLMASHDGTEPLFIKNLENLQGDERDVIFISCTYGPDKESGKVHNRFGPIDGKNGQRRINVLITRAKKRIEIFSSMKPDDITGTSPGAIALKKYLTYADTGLLPDYGTISEREPDSDFEIAVSRVLANYGYKCVPQVGVAGFFVDIGVLHPDRPDEFMLGIECDGATYHSSRFARDRDRLREEVLIRRGWIIHRIWSTDWFKNRQSEIDRLVEKLDGLRKEDKFVVDIDQAEIPLARSTENTLHLTPKLKVTRKAARPTPKPKPLTDKGLRSRLLSYKKGNIPPKSSSSYINILGDIMLDVFVSVKPIDKGEFWSRVSLSLRERIDPDELEYLDDIFSIIEESKHH